MSWYELLLFVHVTAAVVWLGGGLFIQIYGIAVRRGGDSHELATFAGRVGHLGERLFIPSSLLVVLAGIGLMIEGSSDWGQLWVVFALVGFAGTFVTGAFLIGPMAKRLPNVGPETAAGQELIRRIFTISRIDLAFLYAILFGMSVKPTSDDGWTILTGAAILVALTAIFIAQVRSGGPEQRAPAAAD